MLTVPVVILGLVAVVAIVQHGAWHQGAGVMSMQKLAWGSGEEADHKVMQDAADSVGDYDYKVEPLPVNPLIIDEVKKAEAEQGKESKTLAAYAMGKTPEKPKAKGDDEDEGLDEGDLGSAEGVTQDEDQAEDAESAYLSIAKQLPSKEAAAADDTTGEGKGASFGSLAGGESHPIDEAAGRYN